MAHPAPEVLAWASAVLGSEVTVVRSLRLGAFLAAALSQLETAR